MDNIVTLYIGYNLLVEKKNRKFRVNPLSFRTRLSEEAFTINFHGLWTIIIIVRAL